MTNRLNLFLEFIGCMLITKLSILKSAQDQDDKNKANDRANFPELRLNEPSKSPQIKLLNFDVITESDNTADKKLR
jgi:hypothetical protein